MPLVPEFDNCDSRKRATLKSKRCSIKSPVQNSGTSSIDFKEDCKRRTQSVQSMAASNYATFMIQFRFPLGRYMRMAPDFVDTFGHNFKESIKILTRDGKLWKIGIEKDDKGNIWLTENWEKFKKYYEISYQDSMYFFFKGDSKFQVVIFGENGVEKMEILPHNHLNGIYFYKQMMTPSFDLELVLPEDVCYSFWKDFENPLKMVRYDNLEFPVTWIGNESLEKITLTEGWGRFARIHKFEVNDILVVLIETPNKLRVDHVCHYVGRIDQFHIGKSPDPWDMDMRVRNVWTTVLTGSSATKKQPLYVHAGFVNSDLSHKPKKLRVRLEDGTIEEWELKYSIGRKEVKIGKGWYEYKEKNNLVSGDVLKFTRQGMADFFDLKVTKYINDFRN